jgi:hypothetical protein
MSDEDSDIPPVAVGDDEPFEIISRYTRAQAIEDGVLVDVTAQAKEAGIKIPTAMTCAVWNQYVELTPAARQAGNDIEGRRWDILWMVRCAALRQPDACEIHFQLNVVTDRIQPSLVTLKAICGPGDDGTPVITILLPQED